MQLRLEMYLVALRGTVGLFVASEHVTPEQFATFVAPVNVGEEQHGLRSVAVVPRITPDRLGAFEAAMSTHHGREIRVWPVRDADGYFPIAVTQPLDTAKIGTLGFDLASDPLRRSMLATAGLSGEAVASEPVYIVESTPEPQRGFLIALPLYGPEQPEQTLLLGGKATWPPPEEVDDRAEQLQGFIVGAFIVDEFLAAVRARRARPPLPLAIYDGTEFDSNRLLYASPQAGEPQFAAVTEHFEIAGRTWTILFFDLRGGGGWLAWMGLGPHAVGEARLVPVIALLGLVFSSLLFIVTRAQLAARKAAELAAAEAYAQRAFATESERRFRALADAAPVIIWMTGADGQLLWVNFATIEMGGLSLEEMSGQGWRAIVHPDDVEKSARAFRKAVEVRRPFTSEVRIRRRDGEYRWLLTTGRPVFRPTKPGHPSHVSSLEKSYAGYVGIGTDVTDQRLAMERLHDQAEELEAVNIHLERLNTELARSNAELADFAAIAAHDLKEPLRGMSNYARFVREDYGEQVPEKGRDMLETIERLGARLNRLLDAMMVYARVGHGELSLEEIDFNMICRDVMESLNVPLGEPGVEVDCRPIPRITCDPLLASQVLSNLVMNAVRYNTSVSRRIEIGSLESDSGTILYVRDNGIGIPPEHQDRIFKMFKRLHPRDDYGGGLGAGLAIVKKIIERHGGHIWIASEPGRGTTVYFTFSPEPHRMPVEAHEVLNG